MTQTIDDIALELAKRAMNVVYSKLPNNQWFVAREQIKSEAKQALQSYGDERAATARREALEEAAKVADTYTSYVTAERIRNLIERDVK